MQAFKLKNNESKSSGERSELDWNLGVALGELPAASVIVYNSDH